MLLVQVLSEIRDILSKMATPSWTAGILPIVTGGVSICALVFAAISSISASRSSINSRASIRANILQSIIGERYSVETYKVRVALRKYFRKNKNDPKRMMSDFEAMRLSNEGVRIDLNRRRFMTYFMHLLDLRLHNLLNDEDMHTYVNESDLDMLLTISKPLEIVVRNMIPGTARMSFETPDILFDYFSIFQKYYKAKGKIRELDLAESQKRSEIKKQRKILKQSLAQFWAWRRTIFLED